MKPLRPLYLGEEAFEETVLRLASLPVVGQAPERPVEPGGSCTRSEIVLRAAEAAADCRRSLREARRRILRFHRLARARPFAKRRKNGSLIGVRLAPYRSILLDFPEHDWLTFLVSAAGAAHAAGVDTIGCRLPGRLAESPELYAALETFRVDRISFGSDPGGHESNWELVASTNHEQGEPVSSQAEESLPLVGLLPLAILLDETTDPVTLFEGQEERFGVPPILVVAGRELTEAVLKPLRASGVSLEALLVVSDLDEAVDLLNRLPCVRICLPIEKPDRISRRLRRSSWLFLGRRTWPRMSDLFLTGTAVGVRLPTGRVRPLLADDFVVRQVTVGVRGRDAPIMERFIDPLRRSRSAGAEGRRSGRGSAD